MGSAAGDFDGHGNLDFLVTNLQRDYNTLFFNQTPPGGPLRFADETTTAGLNLSTLASLGWAALALNGDHEGTWTSSLPTATSIRRCVTVPRSASRTTSRISPSGTTARNASPPCSFLASGVPAGARPLRISTM